MDSHQFYSWKNFRCAYTVYNSHNETSETPALLLIHPKSRYAVFSFLAGFWREDYTSAITNIAQPTLVVFGKQASSISREGKTETPQERLNNY